MMEYTTQSLDELHVIGIAMRTSNSRVDEIAGLWQCLSGGMMSRIPNPLSNEPYGVYFDYEGDHTAPFTLLGGMLVAPETAAPQGMTKKRIPAARYAVFSGAGPVPDSVIATWQGIWKTNLNRTYQADFEVYHSPDSLSIYVGIA